MSGARIIFLNVNVNYAVDILCSVSYTLHLLVTYVAIIQCVSCMIKFIIGSQYEVNCK